MTSLEMTSYVSTVHRTYKAYTFDSNWPCLIIVISLIFQKALIYIQHISNSYKMRTKYKHTSADGTVLILTTYNYTDRRKIEFWCHL